MEKELTTYTLETDNLYKYICHIGVTKVRKFKQITKIHSKGEKVPNFKLFGIPFSYRICENDEYFVSGYNIQGSINDIIRTLDIYFLNVFYKDSWLYHYGIVEVFYLCNKKPEKHKFRSNEELEWFVNELKEKCKEQGNILKIN